MKTNLGFYLALALALTLLLPAFIAAAEDGMLDNGDFERAASVSGVEGWSVGGTVEYIGAGQRQGNMLLVVPEGRHAVRLGNDAQISQEIKALEKGSTYSLTFSAARTCAQLESLNISAPPASRNIDLQTLYTTRGWDAYAWAFTAQSEVAQLAFHNPGMEEDPTCGPVIDAVALKHISTPDKIKGNPVVNGDFEEGPWMFRNATLGVLLPTNLDVATSPLPGWIVESNKAVRYIDGEHYRVPEGRRAVELLSGKEGIISQMVDTEPGHNYTLSFLLGDAGDNCQTPMAVMAFAGDQADNFHYTPPAIRAYDPNNVTFTAKALRTRIAFYSIYYNTRTLDRSSLCGPVIDQIRVFDLSTAAAAAAGPNSALSLLLGLCLLVGLGLGLGLGLGFH